MASPSLQSSRRARSELEWPQPSPTLPSEPSTADGAVLTALLAPRAHTLMSDSAVSETSHDAPSPFSRPSPTLAKSTTPPDREPRSLGSFRHDAPRSFSGFHDGEPRSYGETRVRRKGFIPLVPAPQEPRSLGPLYAPVASDPRRVPSTTSSQGLSWHRRGSETKTIACAQETTVTTTTTTVTTMTTRSAVAPETRQVPFVTRAKTGKVSYRRQRKTVSNLGLDGRQELGTGREKKGRKGSYMTGFARRKGSAFGWLGDERRRSTFREPVEAVHEQIELKGFGRYWWKDAVVLYTNSMRAELNDLVFLTGCLRSRSGERGRRGGRHKKIEIDFELWFARFASYTELMLDGFERILFGHVTQLLQQRDVMISRPIALTEAAGRSYVQLWGATMRKLKTRMGEARSGVRRVGEELVRADATQWDADGQTWGEVAQAVCALVTAVVPVLDDVDREVAAFLRLSADGRKRAKRVYAEFAVVLTRGGEVPLGWSGIITATRWMADRKVRSEHTGMMARCSRQSLFQRYRADNSHHTIVKIHRAAEAVEGRRRGLFS